MIDYRSSMMLSDMEEFKVKYEHVSKLDSICIKLKSLANNKIKPTSLSYVQHLTPAVPCWQIGLAEKMKHNTVLLLSIKET